MAEQKRLAKAVAMSPPLSTAARATSSSSSGSLALGTAEQFGGWNLSAGTGQSAVSATNAAAYIRSDGYNSVLFETSDNRIREMVWKPGTNWTWLDLSVNANEPP